MFFSSLSFISGIIAVQQLSSLPELIWVISLLIISLCFAWLRYWQPVIFITGFLWAVLFAYNRLENQLPEALEGQLIAVEGQILGLPQVDDRKVRFDFKVNKPLNTLPSKIRLSWYFPKQLLRAGQTWQFTVKLKTPHGRFNPNSFDYERWLMVNNIGATGYVRNNPTPELISTQSAWTSISVMRQSIADKLDTLPVSMQFVDVIKALTIGERHGLSQLQWDVFRNTGTVHLLAISGLHIGIVSGLIYWLVLTLCIRFSVVSPQNYAAMAAILIALFYSALAGFSLPTQRSLVMLTVAMFAITRQRNVTPVNTLSVTALTVLIVDPFVVLSAGFWLSFLAVTVIIYSLAGRIAKPKKLLSILKTHWVTSLALAPLLLYYFQQVSIIAPLANFFTVPLVSLLVVPLCLMAVMMMYLFPAISENIFLLVDYILQLLWQGLSAMVKLPYATLSSFQPALMSVLLAMLGIAILLSPKGVPARWLGAVLLIPLSFLTGDKLDKGNMRVTLLDVGQGLSTVVETQHHVLVFDTGAKYSNSYDMGNAVVIPFLKSKAIESVDRLIISHGDNDHIGGAESILNGTHVRGILTSAPEMLANPIATLCKSGQSWEWDQVKFTILAPEIGELEGDNNNSCVLKVISKTGAVLLTGDIEKPAEDWLLERYSKQLNCDILIAPHHGSKSSSSLAFLKQVSPDSILIPAGYKNRFSFPHSEVLERYKMINANWWNTADSGALVVETGDNELVIKSMRVEHRKYWNN